MFEKVLFPTDFSDYAQKTLECVSDIPGVKDVVLLHVIDSMHPSKRELSQAQHVENAKVRLEEQKERLENIGLRVKTKVDVITDGDVSRAFVETVNKENVSLVVMGAHGKSLIEGVLLGSAAMNVLRYGKTNVLIMRYKLAEWLGAKKFENSAQGFFQKCFCLPISLNPLWKHYRL